MGYSTAYQTAFYALAKRMHFEQHTSPDTVIALWKTVVYELEAGLYPHPCELDNDLDVVREPIATFFVADDLTVFPEHMNFINCIKSFDEKFKELTVERPLDGPKRMDFRWWQDRVPTYWIELLGE
jgi:hypothetical protein